MIGHGGCRLSCWWCFAIGLLVAVVVGGSEVRATVLSGSGAPMEPRSVEERALVLTVERPRIEAALRKSGAAVDLESLLAYAQDRIQIREGESFEEARQRALQRYQAVLLLGYASDSRSHAVLVELLEDDRVEIRVAAACALAARGDSWVVPVLRGLVAQGGLGPASRISVGIALMSFEPREGGRVVLENAELGYCRYASRAVLTLHDEPEDVELLRRFARKALARGERSSTWHNCAIALLSTAAARDLDRSWSLGHLQQLADSEDAVTRDYARQKLESLLGEPP